LAFSVLLPLVSPLPPAGGPFSMAAQQQHGTVPAIPGPTVPSCAVSLTPFHTLPDARLLSGAAHSASLLSQAPVTVKAAPVMASVGSADCGGVIYTSVGGRSAVSASITNLHSGASRASPRGPPDNRFEQAHRLNGILACFPEGGDEPNHLRRGLLPSNGLR
jgi:hypothetical protein